MDRSVKVFELLLNKNPFFRIPSDLIRQTGLPANETANFKSFSL